jgi:predicted metal-dependent hydrolase
MLFLTYVTKESVEVASVLSSIDNQTYIVRNLPDKQKAADMLATISEKLQTIVSTYHEKNVGDSDAIRLKKNFNPRAITEGTENSQYTSYSVNKGEKIVFCLRSRDGKMKLIDENVLMYVAVHELGHLMTKEVGHTASFWMNFKKILTHAIDIDLYDRVDFAKSPHRYCGITISNSIV